MSSRFTENLALVKFRGTHMYVVYALGTYRRSKDYKCNKVSKYFRREGLRVSVKSKLGARVAEIPPRKARKICYCDGNIAPTTRTLLLTLNHPYDAYLTDSEAFMIYRTL